MILALDFYLRLNRVVADDKNPEVIALSQILGELPIHPSASSRPAFSQPERSSAVARELQSDGAKTKLEECCFSLQQLSPDDPPEASVVEDRRSARASHHGT